MRTIGWYVILIYLVSNGTIYGQSKYDYTWILGYNYTDTTGGGFADAAEGMIIDFNVSPPSVTSHPTPYHLKSISVISHPETGKLQYYTNGCRIINADHETMMGGDSLNYSTYYKYFCDIGLDGFHSDYNGTLSLPAPGQADKYYMIHRPRNLENPPFTKVCYTVVDMTLDGGKGGVIEKNVVVKNDVNLAYGYQTACKHQNGIDWWIIMCAYNTNKIYAFLLTAQGISFSHSQVIGTVGPYAIGQATFSPDGSRYVWYDLVNGVHLYDFDRSTGMLSDHKEMVINEYYQYGRGGVSISPNSRFAYFSAQDTLYQLDLWEEDPYDGLEIIDTIKYITSFGIGLNFSNSMLGPDCRIYISTGFTWETYHIIHKPDEKGKACGLEKLGLTLPWPNSNSAIPNMVHYRMDEAEVCNPRISSLFPISWYKSRPRIYPNPASDHITIESSTSCSVDIYHITGQQVLSTQVVPSGQIDISGLKDGVYIVKCKGTDGTSAVTKIIKQ